MNKTKFKNILTSIILFTSSTPIYAADPNMDLVDVVRGYIESVSPLMTLLIVFSVAVGLYFIGNAGYRLSRLGQDQNIRGFGIVIRLIAGGCLCSLPVFIALTAGSTVGGGRNDFYRSTIEQAGRPAKEVLDNKGCISGGKNCDQY